MNRWLMVPLSVCMLATTVRAAEPTPGDSPLNRNAALKYWQGFASLPKLTEEQQKLLEAPIATGPLDDRLKEIVTASTDALREMHHGAKIADCAWGVSFEDGFNARLNHLQAARTTARIACLRARLRIAEGNVKGAIDDAVAAATLGRHASWDGTLVAYLVGMAIETIVTDTLAAHLPELDKEVAKELAARWEKLPPSESIANALLRAEEKAGLDWFITKLKAAKDRKEVENFLNAIAETPELRKPLLASLAEGGTERLIKDIEPIRDLYREFGKKLNLPPDEFDKEYDKRIEALKEKNAVARLLGVALSKMRRAAARLEARQALWKTAMAIHVEGPDALKAHRDPFGDGPFERVPLDGGGYELRSKLRNYDGKQATLTVGLGKK
jgi:hypothetical protein